MEHQAVCVVVVIPRQQKESIVEIRVNFTDTFTAPIDGESDTFVKAFDISESFEETNGLKSAISRVISPRQSTLHY